MMLGACGLSNSHVTVVEYDQLLEAYVAFAYGEPPEGVPPGDDLGAQRIIELGHQLNREALQALFALGANREQVLLFLESEDLRTGGRPRYA